MYPNLNAEFARQNLTLEKTVEGLKDLGVNMTIGTLSLKKSGKYPITLDEAKAIKTVVKTDLPLEVLFSKEAI